MKELDPYLNSRRQNGEEYEPVPICNFQCRIHRPEWKETSSCYREWQVRLTLRLLLLPSAVHKFECGFSQTSTLTFLHRYFAFRKLKYSRIDRNPFSNFNNLQLLRLLSNRLVYIQHDFFTKFLYKLVVVCSFRVARVIIINTLWRKPFELSDQKRKQASITRTRVPYDKLFTNLASSSRTEECWPSFPVRPSRSVSKRSL